MQLPELALPDQGLGSPNGDCRTGDENEADNYDNEDGDDDGDNYREPDRNCLVDGEWKAVVLLVSHLKRRGARRRRPGRRHTRYCGRLERMAVYSE